MNNQKAIEERMNGLFRSISNLNSELAYCGQEEEEWYKAEIDRLDEEYELLKNVYYGKN